MYCEHCKKQSPEHFRSCVYCGEPFPAVKKHRLPKRAVGKQKRFGVSKKAVVAVLLCTALLVAVCAVITAAFTSSKPERVVRLLTASTQEADAEQYYKMYDECIKAHQKEYLYFDDDATFTAMTAPMQESDAFYRRKCGDGYRLTYQIEKIRYLGTEEVEAYNALLKETYGYTRNVNALSVMDVNITAKGENGSYQTEYRDFLCMRMGNHWYRAAVALAQTVPQTVS